MRLNNTIRDRIIDSILEDLPREDYVGAAKTLVEYEAFVQLSNAHPELISTYKNNRHLLAERYATITFGCSALISYADFKMHRELKDQVQDLVDKEAEQYRQRRDYRCQLTALFSNVNTVKSALEKFPEFGAYIRKSVGAEPEPLKNLPATQELINNLKLAGWKNETVA